MKRNQVVGEDYGSYLKIKNIYSSGAGLRHRIDGPAIEYEDGRLEWYINGYYITDEVNGWMIENNYSWPWDKETQVQFELTFAHNYDEEPLNVF